MFNRNADWNLVLLGDGNLIFNTNFKTWDPKQRMPSPWSLEDITQTKGWDTTDGGALRIYQRGKQRSWGRLFCRVPMRRGRMYRLTMKLRGDPKVYLHFTGGPWQRYATYNPPPGVWRDFTEVSFEYTVGLSAHGEIGHFFLAMSSDRPGELLIAEMRLVELPAMQPVRVSNMLDQHGLESLAASNFGVQPLELLALSDGELRGPRVIYRDTATGTEIWKVTHFIHLDRLLATNKPAWSADGRSFAYYSHYFPDNRMIVLLSADATRTIRQKAVSGIMRWADTGHELIQFEQQIVAFDPLANRRRVIFETPKDMLFPGRNYLHYTQAANKVLQYARLFQPKAKLRIWDVATKTHRNYPLRSATHDAYKDKDWLYSAQFIAPDVVGYGLNHKPRMSEHNFPQSWQLNLTTDEYTLSKDVHDRPSHGAMSPGGKIVGYFPEGLCYKPHAGAEKIYIGGLGGDGHMAFLYQDKVAVSGDVSDEALVSMILPDTRYQIPVAYAQNMFTGYYGSIIFESMSPDVTKLVYSSDMLGYRDLYWAIMNYPKPPRNVKATRDGEGVRITWEPPDWHAEIAGYSVYNSTQSGRGFVRLNDELIDGTSYLDTAPGASAYYVVRSIEHSGLASRAFSNEAAAGDGPYRLYHEAEYFDRQRTPFRLHIDADAGNEKAMRVRPITDESLDNAGALSYDVDIPGTGTYRLWLRVMTLAGRTNKRTIDVVINGRELVSTPVQSEAWRWQRLDTPAALSAGKATITLRGHGEGLCIDRLLLTSDPEAQPQGRGDDLAIAAPTAVSHLETQEVGRHHLTLNWSPVAHADLHHYQVYRGEGEVAVEQRYLVGSPAAPPFIDYNLRPGVTYHYTITAVDNWGNASDAGPTINAATQALPQRVVREIALGGMKTVNEQALDVKFDLPIDDTYVIWLRAATGETFMTYYQLQIDNQPVMSTGFLGIDRKAGQAQQERLQWQRVFHTWRDAGTRFDLKAGAHVLHFAPWPKRNTELLIDAVIVTNDQSHTPPGPRFLF